MHISFHLPRPTFEPEAKQVISRVRVLPDSLDGHYAEVCVDLPDGNALVCFITRPDDAQVLRDVFQEALAGLEALTSTQGA